MNMRDLMAKAMAERLFTLGYELVVKEAVEKGMSEQDARMEDETWDEIDQTDRDTFTGLMRQLLDETYLDNSMTVTQGDALLFVINDPNITHDECVPIKDNLEKLFDGVRVNVLVAGPGVSVIKGQQPLCGVKIGEPIWTGDGQELNEQAQAPCILRGEHKDYPHENKFGVTWVVNEPNKAGIYEEQNGSEHGTAYKD